MQLHSQVRLLYIKSVISLLFEALPYKVSLVLVSLKNQDFLLLQYILLIAIIPICKTNGVPCNTLQKVYYYYYYCYLYIYICEKEVHHNDDARLLRQRNSSFLIKFIYIFSYQQLISTFLLQSSQTSLQLCLFQKLLFPSVGNLRL